MINNFTVPQVSDVAVDDGDYFIQSGSEFLVQQFKKTRTNNTDKIKLTVKVRSTESTIVTPMCLQIYNWVSTAWETLGTETLKPADTDFIMQGSVIASLSNYYDSNNVLQFRVYQQVM